MPAGRRKRAHGRPREAGTRPCGGPGRPCGGPRLAGMWPVRGAGKMTFAQELLFIVRILWMRVDIVN